MTKFDLQAKPSEREKAGAVYLDRARALMIEGGLSEAQADRVVILHALSRVGDDPIRIADWLEAEARAIRLAIAEPSGSA